MWPRSNAHPLHPRRGTVARNAFTLVEVLLVVTILGVLAGAAVSMFGDTSTDAKDAVLMQNLQAIRVAFERFKVDHNGRLPGFTNLDDFGDHLTKYSNAAGAISATPSPSYPYGPYIPDRALINPVNNGYTAHLSLDPVNESPNNTLLDGEGNPVGWFLDVLQGRISANAEGQTSAGTLRVKL